MTASSAIAASTEKGSTNVLVIDDDDLVLDFLRVCLESELPNVVVTTYDSKRLGRPGADFDWAKHDVLLLDYNLGHGETGTEWLNVFSSQPGFPKTILLTAEDSATLVGEAILSGAGAYLNKTALTPAGLATTVTDVMESTVNAPANASVNAAGGAPVEHAKDKHRSELSYRGRDKLDTGPGGASYRFIRLIGRGAMSRVYLAERNEDGSMVVLKILERDVSRDPLNVQRFADEGALLYGIDSPYVVKVFDHGMTNSYGYIAMEFFGRGDLAQTHPAAGVGR